MNPYKKPLLLATAIVIGALAVTGCASSRRVADNTGHYGNSYRNNGQIALDTQINMSHLHPDTHPEWRLGMNMAFPHPPGHFQAGQLSDALDQPQF